MYYDTDRRLAYLAHPRVASSATANALLGAGFKRCPGRRHHDGIPDGFDREGWTVFLAVRNTWDTVVSWLFLLQCEPPFEVADLQKLLTAQNCVRNGRLWWFLDDADIVLRYEDLVRFGIIWHDELPVVELEPVNVGEERAGRPYQPFYTDETREWVATTFAKDIEETSYAF